MKNAIYEKPMMEIASFSAENIVTTSAVQQAKSALATSGSDLLGGRQALDLSSMIELTF